MLRFAFALLAALAVASVAAAVPARAATLNATPATLASVLGQAQAGDTITLAAGSYGTWAGTNKAVTLQAADGATVTMGLNFTTGDQGFTLDGLRVSGGNITAGAKNITVRNSAFTSTLTIDGVANAAILLDHDTFNNINYTSGGTPARIHLAYSSSTPSGVMVSNSLFSGGSTDGIQSGVGLSIIGNEFTNIREGSCAACHTDAIQLIGASGSVVRGNWLHNNQDGITAFDGLSNATITDNAIGPQQSDPDCIDMYALQNSTIAHNSCTSGMDIWLDHKTGDPTSSGVTIRDNFAPRGLNGRDVTSNATAKNLTNPVYAGGSSPTSYDGFRLSALSPGLSGGSDGLNVGIRFPGVDPDPTPTPTASPSPSPTASPAPTPTATATPSPEPTPTPEPPYTPTCKPDCDDTIAALRNQVVALTGERDVALATVEGLRDDVERLTSERDAAQAHADALQDKINTAITALGG